MTTRLAARLSRLKTDRLSTELKQMLWEFEDPMTVPFDGFDLKNKDKLKPGCYRE
jgi:hypothetical protein